VSGTARSGPAHFADPAAALAALASLVLKERVLLGGLPAPQQAAVLGLAWCALPAGVALREPEVNAALKRCLAEACSFLDVDHVELRRRLVDVGWLVRDGFGREYRRLAAQGLAAEYAHIATAVSAIDPPRWAAGIRDAATAQRNARRQAWEARQAAEPAQRTQPGQGGANNKSPA
jgi:hypothetical protein